MAGAADGGRAIDEGRATNEGKRAIMGIPVDEGELTNKGDRADEGEPVDEGRAADKGEWAALDWSNKARALNLLVSSTIGSTADDTLSGGTNCWVTAGIGFMSTRQDFPFRA